MTLIEFLKSQASQDSPIGDLAKDIMADKDFPYQRPEDGMLSYIEFQARRHGNADIFHEMTKAFQTHKNKAVDPMDLDVNFNPLKAEQWTFLKAHFPIDRAITVGELGDIYRVYGVDSISQRAIKFDIYSRRNLNELPIVSLDDIFMGDLSREVSIQEALNLLDATEFNQSRKPIEPNYSEMIEYLSGYVM